MNEAINIDCMEYMRSLPDKAFDLAVCDPPYGISITSQTVHVERERERAERRSAAADRSEVKIQVGGRKLSCPKAITLLTTKSHQMRRISPSSKE